MSAYQKIGLINYRPINRVKIYDIRNGINILSKNFPRNLNERFYIFKNKIK